MEKLEKLTLTQHIGRFGPAIRKACSQNPKSNNTVQPVSTVADLGQLVFLAQRKPEMILVNATKPEIWRGCERRERNLRALASIPNLQPPRLLFVTLATFDFEV